MDNIISWLSHPHIIKILFLTTSGFAIRQALVFSGQRWANTYHHLGSYLLLPNIALIITSVIKDDIALSLGMIGALSIVRFRNPVKSPFELVMFFALLTLGIVTSVSLFLAVLLALLVIFVIFGIKIADKFLKKFQINIFQYSFGDGNLNYTIEINASKKIADIENKKNVVNFFFDNDKKFYSYRLVFETREELLAFKDKISSNKDVINARADIQS